MTLTRAHAIRRLVALGLRVKTKSLGRSQDRKGRRDIKQRARELAVDTIDEIADTAASPQDQARRKRRSSKGRRSFKKSDGTDQTGHEEWVDAASASSLADHCRYRSDDNRDPWSALSGAKGRVFGPIRQRAVAEPQFAARRSQQPPRIWFDLAKMLQDLEELRTKIRLAEAARVLH